jgi:hypothetical protein
MGPEVQCVAVKPIGQGFSQRLPDRTAESGGVAEQQWGAVATEVVKGNGDAIGGFDVGDG